MKQNILAAIQSAAQSGPGDPCPAELPSGGAQKPGDFNQDSRVDISDPIALLSHLFGGGTNPLPCEATGLDSEGNRALLDVNADKAVDISDAVYLLDELFLGGPPPVMGSACTRLQGCSERCSG